MKKLAKCPRKDCPRKDIVLFFNINFLTFLFLMIKDKIEISIKCLRKDCPKKDT